MDGRIYAIQGWMGDEELEYLHSTVKSAPNDALIVELGAWKGRSTAALYTALHDQQQVVTVDTWLGQPDLRHSSHGEVFAKDIFLEFLYCMESVGVYPRWYVADRQGAMYLRAHSVDAATLFADKSIYRLIIDSDHTAVGEDIDAWRQKVIDGGSIAGHDHSWGGVKEQVEARFPITAVVGDMWIAEDIG